ncbi:MAG: Hpt domain-containing protein [Caulobacterales bacterium]|nr:Hpt domain-containing protein [Caulobacterales bacterium]
MSRRDLSGAVDVTVLEAFTQGDGALADEVLGLFQEQARLWSPLLDAREQGWRDAVHTLKGSAAGVGAQALRDACERAEQAGDDIILAGRLEAVRDALDTALADVAAWRHELMLKSLRG